MTRTFDRIPSPDDPRDKLFGIAPRVANLKPFSREWTFGPNVAPDLDQGRDGACVGFGLGNELALDPVPCPMTNEFARRIYWAAQRRDTWPGGAYPGARPHYEGTDLRSGLKTLRDAGACDTYERAFDIDTTILGISHNGPPVFGMMWTEGMSVPDANGFVRPTGRHVGGHCICGRAVDMEREYVRLIQTYGRDHGVNGEILLRFKDLEWIMARDCEVYFLAGRKPITIDNLPPAIRASWWARLFGWR